MIVVVIMNVIVGTVALAAGDPLRIVVAVAWSALACWFYVQLARSLARGEVVLPSERP